MFHCRFLVAVSCKDSGFAPPSTTVAALFFRHFSLQNFTSAQQRSHFLRQLKGRWQTGQIFIGKCSFFICGCNQIFEPETLNFDLCLCRTKQETIYEIGKAYYSFQHHFSGCRVGGQLSSNGAAHRWAHLCRSVGHVSDTFHACWIHFCHLGRHLLAADWLCGLSSEVL